MYMIAELSRRIGDLENATRFFSKVIENQRYWWEAKLMEMAKEQWQLCAKNVKNSENNLTIKSKEKGCQLYQWQPF